MISEASTRKITRNFPNANRIRDITSKGIATKIRILGALNTTCPFSAEYLRSKIAEIKMAMKWKRNPIESEKEPLNPRDSNRK